MHTPRGDLPTYNMNMARLPISSCMYAFLYLLAILSSYLSYLASPLQAFFNPSSVSGLLT